MPGSVTIRYVSFGGMLELSLKIIHNESMALKAQLLIICGLPTQHVCPCLPTYVIEHIDCKCLYTEYINRKLLLYHYQLAV